jgi:DNA polymerase III subunit epsilon
MIQLKRPIVFFDIEATGLSIIHDRIVQISLLKIFPDGNEEIKNFLFNPEISIPEEVIAIHGITNEKVKDQPLFKEKAKEIDQFLKDCDLGGFNLLKFDVPMLLEEFIRAGMDFDIDQRSIIDVQAIFHKMEQRTLTAAYKFYCEKELQNAHDAEADTKATWEVFNAQLARYEQLSKDLPGIISFIGNNNRVDLEGRIVKNDKGEEIFNFGKHKGKKVTQVFETEPSYYNWILDGDFSGYTKKVVQRIKLNMLKDKFSGG